MTQLEIYCSVELFRQSVDLRLRAAMVFRLAGKSTGQGRRKNVEETNGVHDDQRAPGVLGTESTIGENGLRREKRWTNLVSWQ